MNNNWPFIPDHISNDMQAQGLKGNGIISNEELSGLQMLVASKLQVATTIVEFFKDNDPVKTDSNMGDFPLRKSCRLFRKYTNRCYCDYLDKRSALLFKDCLRNNLEIQLNNNISKELAIKNPFNAFVKPYTIGKKHKRHYLYYDCPFLGFRELLFPIFFDETVIACFFIGELLLRSEIKNIEIRRNLYFENNKPDFDESLLTTAKLKSKDIIDYIQNIDAIDHQNDELFDKLQLSGIRANVISQTRYESIINSACKELDKLEAELKIRLELFRNKYEYSTIQKQIKSLQQKLPERIIVDDASPLEEYWKKVDLCLKELVASFNFRYCAIFAVNSPLVLENDKLPLVSFSNNSENPTSYKRQIESFYSTSIFPTDYKYTFNSVDIEKDRLLSGLPRDWYNAKNPKNTSVLLYPIPFHWQTPLVVVIGHKQDQGPEDYRTLRSVLDIFFVNMVSILSSFLESINEQRTIASFKVLGHEISTQTEGLLTLVQTSLGDAKSIKSIDSVTSELVCLDTACYVDQINLLFRNARRVLDLLWGRLLPEYTSFYLVGPLFHKWKSFYRHDIINKIIDIKVPKADESDLKRPKINADSALIEQLIYNLLDNAIKYCQIGSNLYMDCEISNNKSIYSITVKDYGKKIPMGPEGELCYRLFQRSDLVKGIPGLGIGLTLSRAIARAHNGDLVHKTIKISKYNVPMLVLYQNYLKNGYIPPPNYPSYDKVINEVKRISYRKISEIVSYQIKTVDMDNKYIPLWDECVALLFQPTYEITFYVTLSQ